MKLRSYFTAVLLTSLVLMATAMYMVANAVVGLNESRHQVSTHQFAAQQQKKLARETQKFIELLDRRQNASTTAGNQDETATLLKSTADTLFSHILALQGVSPLPTDKLVPQAMYAIKSLLKNNGDESLRALNRYKLASAIEKMSLIREGHLKTASNRLHDAKAQLRWVLLYLATLTFLYILTLYLGTSQVIVRPMELLAALSSSPDAVKQPSKLLAPEEISTFFKALATTLQKAEESKHRALHAAESKIQLLRHLNHELRTPMNAILGLSELLAESDLDDEHREMARLIQSSSNDLMNQLEQLLTISTLHDATFESNDIEFEPRAWFERISALLSTFTTQQKHHFFAEVSPRTPEKLMGDPHRLQQMLIKLVGSIVQHTSEGALIRVVVEPGYEDDAGLILELAVTCENSSLTRVEQRKMYSILLDPPEEHAELEKDDLSLTFCYSLLEAMEASIIFDDSRTSPALVLSVPFNKCVNTNVSSTATVTPEDIIPRDTFELTLPPPDANGLHILLAEDDPVSRQLALHALSSLGHHVTAVTNGNEVLTALESTPTAFDVVVMDIRMPQMSGVEATMSIRKSQAAWKDIPIIALTGQTLEPQISAYLDIGMNAFVPKPLHRESLEEAIQVVTELSQRDSVSDVTRDDGGQLQGE